MCGVFLSCHLHIITILPLPYQFEYILFLRKGKHKKINNCGTSDILSIPNKKTKDENGKNLHDTEKPVELARILIENSSNEGDLVYDPFRGSGTTAKCANVLSRNFIGSELSEEYWRKSNERISGYINQEKLF